MSRATETARTLVNLQASLDHESSDAQRFLELIQIAVSSRKVQTESIFWGATRKLKGFGLAGSRYRYSTAS